MSLLSTHAVKYNSRPGAVKDGLVVRNDPSLQWLLVSKENTNYQCQGWEEHETEWKVKTLAYTNLLQLFRCTNPPVQMFRCTNPAVPVYTVLFLLPAQKYSFSQVLDSPWLTPPTQEGRAMFPTFAFMSHSCDPNGRHIIQEDGSMHVLAQRHIHKGQEVRTLATLSTLATLATLATQATQATLETHICQRTVLLTQTPDCSPR